MLNKRQVLSGWQVGHGLHDPGRPFDAHQVEVRCIAQAKVGFQQSTAEITITAVLISRICQKLRPPMVALTRTLAPTAERFEAVPTSRNLAQALLLPSLW